MKEDTLYPLPQDVMLPVKLMKVEVRTIDFTYKKGPKVGEQGSFDLWKWEFEIIDGEYAGLHCWGETEAEINNLPEAKGRAKLARPWIETLIGRQLQIGEDFDTDNILGLTASATLVHEEPRQKADGGYYYGCPVDELFPTSGAPDFVPF